MYFFFGKVRGVIAAFMLQTAHIKVVVSAASIRRISRLIGETQRFPLFKFQPQQGTVKTTTTDLLKSLRKKNRSLADEKITGPTAGDRITRAGFNRPSSLLHRVLNGVTQQVTHRT
ncbi:hypothetical protein AXK12_05750 [Cephaloticoccus capnophilus]|uniref:Uncharacterized protein n=1 Tax=Cephaloticoccus capnophilus TaxID=1548208 RepID=A0A139SL07_9BACT|nr:hypothetical protein AXK12_05750 [Cephaloticoccus capnophilus]